MFHTLPTLQKLLRHLQKVPYLASKNMYRVAIHFLNSDKATLEQLCKAIMDAKDAIAMCSICFNWTESAERVCALCVQPGRKKEQICVVETWYDLHALEKIGEYRGVYHVLGGALCPLEGLGPESLFIEPLLKRLQTDITELIFATNPTPEGEATASYIASKITNSSIKISKLASGVPTGSSLEYMDRITISKALSGRQPF